MSEIETKSLKRGDIMGACIGNAKGLRWAGFLIDQEDLNRIRASACEALADTIAVWFDNLSKEEIEEIRRDKEPLEVLGKHGLELDDLPIYVPTIEEKAAELLLTKKLREIGGPEAQVTDEPAYGLPEFSLYWSWDARSFCGKWILDEDEMDHLYFGFIHDEETMRRIKEIHSALLKAARSMGKRLLFAVWRE